MIVVPAAGPARKSSTFDGRAVVDGDPVAVVGSC